MKLALIALPHLALIAAIWWGALINYRWMQRYAEGTTPMGASPDTMLDRIICLIDTSRLKSEEIALVRNLQERRKRSPVVHVTTDEFKMIKQIHGRLYR